jgi:hypothetical protein
MKIKEALAHLNENGWKDEAKVLKQRYYEWPSCSICSCEVEGQNCTCDDCIVMEALAKEKELHRQRDAAIERVIALEEWIYRLSGGFDSSWRWNDNQMRLKRAAVAKSDRYLRALRRVHREWKAQRNRGDRYFSELAKEKTAHEIYEHRWNEAMEELNNARFDARGLNARITELETRNRVLDERCSELACENTAITATAKRLIAERNMLSESLANEFP